MNNKNMLVTLITVITFLFLVVIGSTLDPMVKVGGGIVLALVVGFIVYKLNLFEREVEQKILENLEVQQDSLKTLIETVKNQNEILTAQMAKGQEENVACLNKVCQILEANHKQVLQMNTTTYESLIKEVVSVGEKLGQQIDTKGKELYSLLEQIDAQNKKTCDVLEKISSQSKEIAGVLQENSNAMLQRVEEVCNQQKGMLAELMKSYEGISAYMKEKQTQVMDAFEEAIERIKELQADKVEELKVLQEQNIEGLKEIQEKNIEDLKEAIEDCLDELDDHTHEHTKKMLESMTKTQKALSQELQDKNTELTEGMGKSLDTHLGNIEEATKEMIKQYEDIKIYIETLQNSLIDLNEKDIEILKKYLK